MYSTRILLNFSFSNIFSAVSLGVLSMRMSVFCFMNDMHNRAPSIPAYFLDTYNESAPDAFKTIFSYWNSTGTLPRNPHISSSSFFRIQPAGTSSVRYGLECQIRLNLNFHISFISEWKYSDRKEAILFSNSDDKSCLYIVIIFIISVKTNI